ncbi:MAG TPA: dephospho-CoA kinase [Bryobacteraceae bacterium]|nr:dephospho-CoA kinase [Bryobacteraceae bacterium]
MGLHVGLTGGLASGKSFVGSVLAELGCFLIRADELGHEVMTPSGEAYDAVVLEFGSEILNPDRTIDRRRLGGLVFSDPSRLDRLNALVHPPVRARVAALAEGFFRQHPDGIAVTEAAILVETGSYRNYARLIVAVCRPEQQIERAMARDGLSRQEVLDRLARQMSLQEKAKYADYIVDTAGPKEQTRERTRAVYESLRELVR